jgi:predicted ABC-class ATPase
MGGSGDYFEHADTVIVMDNYLPSDQTQQAHAIAAQHAATLAAVQPSAPAAAGGQLEQGGVRVTHRVPQRVYAAPQNDFRGVKTHVRGLRHIQVILYNDHTDRLYQHLYTKK